MAWQSYATAAVTALAAAAYALAARAASTRQRSLGRGHAGPAVWFFALIALFLLLAATRQVVARLGLDGAVDPAWDLRLYNAVVPVAASVIVPHAYLVALLRTGDAKGARLIALAFSTLVAVGVAFAWLGGATAEPATTYGTDWSLNSPIARLLIAGVILLPGLVGSAWLVRLARRLAEEAERRRIRLVGWAALGYFVLFTIDAYGLSGPPLLAARLLLAAAGLVSWWAYASTPKMHTSTPPPGGPGESLFGR